MLPEGDQLTTTKVIPLDWCFTIQISKDIVQFWGSSHLCHPDDMFFNSFFYQYQLNSNHYVQYIGHLKMYKFNFQFQEFYHTDSVKKQTRLCNQISQWISWWIKATKIQDVIRWGWPKCLICIETPEFVQDYWYSKYQHPNQSYSKVPHQVLPWSILHTTQPTKYF